MKDKIGGRLEVLDGLRGLAVLIVFFSHTSGRSQSLSDFLDFQGIGLVGVYLFFSLSAYLLGYKIFSKPINREVVFGFYIKRFLRIIPLYYFVISLVFLYQYLTNSYEPKYLFISNGLNGFWEHLIFYRGDGVFWSIVSEMQFYLIVPLVAYCLLRWSRVSLFFIFLIILFNAFIYTGYYAHIIELLPHFSPNTLGRGTFIDVFLVGMLGAFLNYKRPEFLDRHNKYLALVSFISFILLIMLTLILVSKKFLFFDQPFFRFRYISLFYSLTFTVSILSLIKGNHFLDRFFRMRWLKLIGRVGFSFYLVHFSILFAVNHLDLPSMAKFFISFLATLLLSKILYELIEKPSIKLSYRLIRFLKPKVVEN